MERMSRMVSTILLAISLLAGFSSNSEAVPYFAIQFSDGTNSLLIQDNLNGQDLDPGTGAMKWTGSLGDWSLEVKTAQTYDYFGSVSAPKIYLASVNNSTAAGTLTIDVSAVNFLSSTTSFIPAQVAIEGTTLADGNSSITAQLFGGNSNVLLDKSNFIVSTGPLSGDAAGVFGGSAIGGFTSAIGNFSLTSELVIHHNAAGRTESNDYATVPEPFTLMFLGTCLLGAGLVRRKFKA